MVETLTTFCAIATEAHVAIVLEIANVVETLTILYDTEAQPALEVASVVETLTTFCAITTEAQL